MRTARTSRSRATRFSSALPRPRWHVYAGVLLMFATFAQSLLTARCGLDEFASRASADAVLVADMPAELDRHETSSLHETCVVCGGLVTASGCCPQGVPLWQGIPELSLVTARPFAPAVVATVLPPDAPADLFRPPILV